MILCPHCGREFDEAAARPPGLVPEQLIETPRLVGVPFRRKYRMAARVDSELEARVIGLATAWHEKVARITVLNQARFAAIRARLEDGYAAEAVLSAIEQYARDEWHVKNPGARLDLADFFAVKKLERWIREAEDARLKREKGNPRAPVARALQPIVRPLARALSARPLTPHQEAKMASDRLAALPNTEQKDVLDQAVRELKELTGRDWKPSPAYYQVLKQVQAIFARREQEQDHGRDAGGAAGAGIGTPQAGAGHPGGAA